MEIIGGGVLKSLELPLSVLRVGCRVAPRAGPELGLHTASRQLRTSVKALWGCLLGPGGDGLRALSGQRVLEIWGDQGVQPQGPCFRLCWSNCDSYPEKEVTFHLRLFKGPRAEGSWVTGGTRGPRGRSAWREAQRPAISGEECRNAVLCFNGLSGEVLESHC